MANLKITKPKGTKDITPKDSYKWQYVEKKIRKIAYLNNIKLIRTPMFEHTELFLRGVGDSTDIVNKEMYTFEDKGGRSLTLKPESTVTVVRAFLENGLNNEPMPFKTYYISPHFRYEKPQEGRYRQHHQFGIEFFGSFNASADAETIAAGVNFFKELGITEVYVDINSLGNKEDRKRYSQVLKEYYKDKINGMCEDCKRRYKTNPLRILDCKQEGCKIVNAQAPVLMDYLCEESKTHFETVKKLLDASGIEYVVNDKLVRGFDYYTQTVFEFVAKGSNGAASGVLGGGGRYNNLIEEIGGKSIPAVGFGIGLERVILEMENRGIEITDGEKLTAYVVKDGLNNSIEDYKIAAMLKENGISADINHMGRKFKKDMDYAHKIGAKFVVIISEESLNNKSVQVKRQNSWDKEEVKIDELAKYIKEN